MRSEVPTSGGDVPFLKIEKSTLILEKNARDRVHLH